MLSTILIGPFIPTMNADDPDFDPYKNILVETNLIFLYGRSLASFKQAIVGTEHPEEI